MPGSDSGHNISANLRLRVSDVSQRMLDVIEDSKIR